jgi:energy-coupling factor transport system ATP-binding protein
MQIKFLNTSHEYKGLTKQDNVDAIKNINFNIEGKDEFVAIVGKTGSGKSTLIQHINGLLLPTDGALEVFGQTITKNKKKNPKLTSVRSHIGFVFQFPEYQLFEENVLKDVMFGPLNFGFKKEEARIESLKALKRLNVKESILKKNPFELSGGQMRRVAIAGILAYNPDILILDEPTRGLDPQGAIEAMELFDSIHKESHKSIVMITHDMNIVYKYATRVIVMNDGVVKFDGKKEDLFKSNIYLQYDLMKPDVLKMIDNLNDKLNLNLDYNIYTLSDLVKRLEGVKC